MAMQKTTLYLDENVWRSFRMACLKRNMAASPEVELLMRKQLVVWHKEDEKAEEEGRCLVEQRNREQRAKREARRSP